MKTIAAILLMLAPAAFAAAQQESTDEPATAEELKSYTVEIVIFSYTEPVGVGTEIFPPEPQEATPEAGEEPGEQAGADVDTEPAPAVADDAEPGTAPQDVEIHVLGDDEFTMQDVLDRLNRLDAYQPIMHFGWTQPAYPRDVTPPIELRAFGEPPPGLDGSLTLYLSRFLHLVVDLSLQAPDTGSTAAAEPAFDYGQDGGRFGMQEPPRPVYYRIQENRIVKNGDLRYFDHPKFGVLAKVTRVGDEDGAAKDTGPQKLAGVLGQ